MSKKKLSSSKTQVFIKLTPYYMQTEYSGPIETIWPYKDGLVSFEQRLESMNS